MIADCIIFLVCALLFTVIIVAYREIHRLEKVVAILDEQKQTLLIQREIDRSLMARYEIAIASLPPEYRHRMLEKISIIKE